MDRTRSLSVIARAVHETIRAFQSALGEPEIPPWPDAGEMQRWTRDAVEFALSNPTPGAQHDAWCASKRRDGWTWGERKDATKKTHPSLVSFDALPEAEKKKDEILISVVQALAPVLGVGRVS
jgi:hypothetical protein